MSSFASSVLTTLAESHSNTSTNGTYRCETTAMLPYKGSEILLLACGYMFFAVMFGITLLDVTYKQFRPAFLDPVVASRINRLQEMFPNIIAPKADDKADENVDEAEEAHAMLTVKQHVATSDVGALVPYDAITAMEPYIAGKSVDEDLMIMLANGKVFDTVSSYCTSTVRGYAMLSTMLVATGMCLGFLWVHNTIVDPKANNWLGTVSIVGYCLCFFTGVVMCHPTANAVYRNANIALWTNIPLVGKPEAMLKLHSIGIVGFVLLPMVSHFLQALFWGKDKMPNYHVTMTGCGMIFAGAIGFGVFGAKAVYKYLKVTELQANKMHIMFEAFLVFAAFLEFIQFEFYATSVCAGQAAWFSKALVAAMFGPFAMMARHQKWAPQSFMLPPSVLLMHKGVPVATVGPCPTMSFDDVPLAASRLPRVELE